MDAQNTKAKTFSSRIAYSFGAFGHDMFYGMLSTYFMMFVTGHLFNSNAGGEAARMVSFITLTIMVLRIAELVIDRSSGTSSTRPTPSGVTLSHGLSVGGSSLPLPSPSCSPTWAA